MEPATPRQPDDQAPKPANPPESAVDGEPSRDGPDLDRLPDEPLPDASHATQVPTFPVEDLKQPYPAGSERPQDQPVLDPKNPATKPQGTTKDQVDTMESEGQAQQPGQDPKPDGPDKASELDDPMAGSPDREAGKDHSRQRPVTDNKAGG